MLPRRTPFARLLIALAGAVMVLRALVPAGAMPDARALADGQFSLVICTTEGMRAITLDSDGTPHENAPGDAEEAPPCPWAPAGAAAIALAAPGVVSLPAIAPAPTHPPSPAALDARTPTGPPLGPRAPPRFHA